MSYIPRLALDIKIPLSELMIKREYKPPYNSERWDIVTDNLIEKIMFNIYGVMSPINLYVHKKDSSKYLPILTYIKRVLDPKEYHYHTDNKEEIATIQIEIIRELYRLKEHQGLSDIEKHIKQDALDPTHMQDYRRIAIIESHLKN